VEIEREYKTNSSNVEDGDNEKIQENTFKSLWLRVTSFGYSISSLIYANSETRKGVILMNLNDKVMALLKSESCFFLFSSVVKGKEAPSYKGRDSKPCLALTG
jgi:hypothetical protein